MFEDLSLHILDIVENSIRAEAKNIKIKITENLEKDLLSIEIEDDGKGMNEEMVKKVLDPFVTTKSGHKVGLGLPFLAQASKMANGNIFIKSKPGKGTKITAVFQHSHIDRQPLGDIKETLMTLIIGNPEVNFIFTYRRNGKKYHLDTKKLSKNNLKNLLNNLNKIFENFPREVKNE
ncbi:ATP-binding protein [Candidatus Aminicenantes bacterium AC-335-B20]|jgi:signal transduction histidine kinase|nr:ATP-binding protein [SCandidatus Aminicenantes bacterium Aminicenantia_JdfR_composite]MCP2596604.1 ATP-binding protein [Candidatus Aminicenantes bacterium AC-335-G13]MCP2598070.1 ATP-binding protein [Candidatus Aminicenantes bacterium AC-335-L06]MCP2598962.1 ATP-binding protein [Candidatus Aminicenantes bacterium AC-335-B20]MCP2605792.1 ATP-binding protein [Candidatus Aminicenantes bacterium AC-335-O07]MCP2606310.1 ATP-binding protein [Candidatus Aminicenantes bacterium AC-708-I09]MCP26183